MSVDMYLSDSQTQSETTSTLIKQQVTGYEELQKAINDFTLNAPFLTGKAYDSAKSYFSAVLYPLAQGGILLSEAVERAVKKFPEEYIAQVDSGDLKQEVLEAQIREADSLIGQAEAIRQELNSSRTPEITKVFQLTANTMLLNMYTAVKEELEKKLEKLLAFHASSPELFAEIEQLQSAINQGLAQTKTAWNGTSGTFTVPSDLAWKGTIQDKWTIHEAENQPKTEIRVEEYPIDNLGNTEKIYSVYVDGVFDEARTNELQWMIAKEMVKEGVYFYGSLTGVNELYQLITGKDWLSGDESSRLGAAGWLALMALPVGKIAQLSKEIKAGNKLLQGVALTADELQILNKAGYFEAVAEKNIVEPKGSNTSKSDFGAENPVSGQDWNRYFNDKYGAGNVNWKPTSLEDIISNPQKLYGSTKSEIKSILGEGWTEASYGSAGTGWKFTNEGDGMVFYHPGDGIHGGSYYGFSTGDTGKVKIVGEDYIDFSNDKATIIKIGSE